MSLRLTRLALTRLALAPLALGVVVLTLAAIPSRGAAANPPPTPQEGRAFLQANAKAPDVKTTRDGLEYRILRAGSEDGRPPGPRDEVEVRYEAHLLNGDLLDISTTPMKMRVDELIPAWREALVMMRPGAIWEVWSPPNLAYGDKDDGPIPGGSVLQFKIELVGVSR